MFTRKPLTTGDTILIIANLVPVYGVWFEGWSPIEAFVVYSLETMIIGLITLLKLFILTLTKGKDDWYNGEKRMKVSGFFFMLFFALHYGLFVLIQSSIFAESSGIVPTGKGVFYFFFHWYDYVNYEVALMLGVFIVSYLARMLIPFFRSGDYKHISMMRVMFQPYGRIFIQQFTVLLGSMFLNFGAGKVFILVFALVKIFFEVYVNFDHLIDRTVAEAERKARNGE